MWTTELGKTECVVQFEWLEGEQRMLAYAVQSWTGMAI
jgi:hypothetical protein